MDQFTNQSYFVGQRQAVGHSEDRRRLLQITKQVDGRPTEQWGEMVCDIFLAVFYAVLMHF